MIDDLKEYVFDTAPTSDRSDGLKEYVITLHRHEDLDNFYEDMETPGGNLYIPNRRVEVAVRRPFSRNTHYYLTPEEATTIKNDSRVWDIIAAEDIPRDIPTWVMDTVFDKSPESSSDRNWGLLRMCQEDNGSDTWFSNFSQNRSAYIFTGFEGQNVDVVIFDGIGDPNHPEYAVNSDGSGGSRYKEINWSDYSSRLGKPYPYADLRTKSGANHGAHVIGTVAGNRQGWARKSDIYNIDVYENIAGGRSFAWDAVYAWDAAKPVNPAIGRKNPTVTNHSYGSFLGTVSTTDISHIIYRGTRYTSTDWGTWGREEWEQLGFWYRGGTTLYGISRGNFPTVYVDEDTAINRGIVVVCAAGNGRHIWATSANHPDWTNTITYKTGFTLAIAGLPYNYCQGINHSYKAIIVGNVDSAYGTDRSFERPADSSGMGEGVTVFAPGTNILAPVYTGSSIRDDRNIAFRLASYTGTSMASPQIAGLAACILSKYPTYTPQQVKDYIVSSSKADKIEDPGGRVFEDPRTPNRYAYFSQDLNSSIVPTATVTANKTSVNEGGTVDFDIATEYLLAGTVLSWRIVSSQGTITSADFEDGVLSGTVTLDSSRNGYVSLTLSNDVTTENTEKFYLEIKDASGRVLTNSPIITINDTSLTKSYSISADKTSVDEGNSVTFTVRTISVQPGTTLIWNIKDYVNYSSDIDTLAATFVISGTLSSGIGSFSVPITRDFRTEGSERFEVEVRENSLTGPIVATSSEITINDTSVDPTYAISNPDKVNVNEGESVSFTVSTTGIPAGTVLYWTTTGAINPADFTDNSLTGTVTISGSEASGTGTITRTLVEDKLTEGFETFFLNLKVGSITGGTVATSGGVVVFDTSLAPTYTLTANKTVTDESSNVKITLTTTDVADNTLVPYAIYGANIDPTDFIDRIQLTGNFNVIGNKSDFTLVINPDSKTEGPEAAYVRLTGPDRTETVGFTISDTSTEPPDDTVYFYITSSTGAIREGNYLTFTIAAIGIDANITVPYEFLGIPAEDLLDPTQIRGNVILVYDPDASIATGEAGGDLLGPAALPPVVTGVASAQLTVGILENFKTDGLRTVILNLTPDYKYEIRISSSIQIIDVSVDTEPRYYFNFDKYNMIEGSNLLIRLDTMNVPANTVVTANIVAYGNSKITLSDFVGLSDLSITFPPTSNSQLVLTPEIPGVFSYGQFANAAVYRLQTADDFVFEQTEFFYFAVRGSEDTSGVISLLDSGNSLIQAQQIFTGNVSVNLLDKAELQANLGGFTIGTPFWEDTSGMLSEKIFIQGKTPRAEPLAAPFYQPFSYVIKSNKSIDLWRNSIKDMIHPVGLALFSEITNETQPNDVLNAASNVTLDSEISEFFALTADSQKPPFYVSSNLYSNSRFDIPLKSDFAYYIHKYF